MSRLVVSVDLIKAPVQQAHTQNTQKAQKTDKASEKPAFAAHLNDAKAEAKAEIKSSKVKGTGDEPNNAGKADVKDAAASDAPILFAFPPLLQAGETAEAAPMVLLAQMCFADTAPQETDIPEAQPPEDIIIKPDIPTTDKAYRYSAIDSLIAMSARSDDVIGDTVKASKKAPALAVLKEEINLTASEEFLGSDNATDKTDALKTLETLKNLENLKTLKNIRPSDIATEDKSEKQAATSLPKYDGEVQQAEKTDKEQTGVQKTNIQEAPLTNEAPKQNAPVDGVLDKIQALQTRQPAQTPQENQNTQNVKNSQDAQDTQPLLVSAKQPRRDDTQKGEQNTQSEQDGQNSQNSQNTRSARENPLTRRLLGASPLEPGSEQQKNRPEMSPTQSAPFAQTLNAATQNTPSVAAAPLSLPQAGEAALHDAMANVLRVVTTANETRAIVTIDPPSLGRIDVSITVTAAGIEALFRVDSDAVRQMLQVQMEQLKATLQSQGMQVTAMEVDLRSKNERDEKNSKQNDPAKLKRLGRLGEEEAEDDEGVLHARVDLEKGMLHWIA